MIGESALVLFSGGQDSTTCLVWALRNFGHVETIGFDYGQRHSIEMKCRPPILSRIRDDWPEWGNRLREDHLLRLRTLAEISETSLTRDVEIEIQANGLPSTFVPGRNLLFFTYAAAVAYRRGIRHLVGGMCETDYSGYPDCRDDTLKALQVSLTLGLDSRVTLHTPLMWMNKAETWALALKLGGNLLVELILEKTHSCYNGVRTQRHSWGFGCGQCPACELREAGYATFSARPGSQE